MQMPSWTALAAAIALALSFATCQSPEEYEGPDRFSDLQSAPQGTSRWDAPLEEQFPANRSGDTTARPTAGKSAEGAQNPGDPKAVGPETRRKVPVARGGAEGRRRRTDPAQAHPAPDGQPKQPVADTGTSSDGPEKTAAQPKPPVASPPPESPAMPQGPTSNDLTKVAEMQWVCGTGRDLVMHGTLPVPDDFRMLESGRTPFAIRPKGWLKAPVPAQVHVVTRNARGLPAVVEIAARIRWPETLRARSRQTVEVFWGDFEEPQAAAPDPALSAGFALTTTDVFGHTYRFPIQLQEAEAIATVRPLESGSAFRRWRVAGAFMPEGGGTGGVPLPHLMGVHAYITQWSGTGLLSLDLRIHNGLTAGSGAKTAMNQPVGAVYWKSIELHLPPGWNSSVHVEDPFCGAEETGADGSATRSLVKAMPGGKLHLMGPQAQFLRRVTLRKQDSKPTAREGAFVDGLMFAQPTGTGWSWFERPAYFSQMAMLPRLDGITSDGLNGVNALEARLGKDRDKFLGHLQTGSKDGNWIFGGVMGWSHPRGVPQQGAVSGVDIGFVEGHLTAFAASKLGYERIELLHRMNLARQPDAQYKADGDPVGMHGWLNENGVVPFDFRTNGYMVPPEFQYPCRGGPVANPQVREVHKRKLRPPYDQGEGLSPGAELPRNPEVLFAWMPNDGQHMIRHTKNLKALVWLGNDPLAKDDLLHVASLFRLMFHDQPHKEVDWSKGVTLRSYRNWAKTYPNHGLPIDRDHAWGIDIMCAAYQLSDDAWRADAKPWFGKVVELFELASMPSGLIQRVNQPDLFNHKYDAVQTFQLMFLLHARRCMMETVFRDVDQGNFDKLKVLHNRAVDFLFFGHVFTRYQGERWGNQQDVSGPYHRFAVAPKGMIATVPYSFEEKWGPKYLPEDGFGKYVDMAYLLPPLEYGFLLTRDIAPEPTENRYLQRILEIGNRPGTFAKFAQDFWISCRYSHSDNSHNTASAVALLQNLGLM